ncbi:hypothetical protein LIER_00222 [Lithospermum erythrorhizon]|uniref:Neprosin PEP catalytic domain-containing protein n=1 Tax=Lithospermum erythrorhizon TaxID=34254 RepID=A0AAV3NL38_LITER
MTCEEGPLMSLGFKLFVFDIQSPDGDIIDCVLSHQQPAFDNPELKGQKPLNPPERPSGYNLSDETIEDFQLWSMSGESCPQGTVPIRRITEEDILRFGDISTFGRKTIERSIKRAAYKEHEYAIGTLNKGTYFGTQATISLWAPSVEGRNEFSVSQIWLGNRNANGGELNTIEVGWQVYPNMYGGDTHPRFFIYWTRDDYQKTGCYNLVCSGFVQTNSKIVIGASISPVSTYGGEKYVIKLFTWKDPKTGNWWLQYGGNLVGYWPSFLFTNLRSHARYVHFGGEIINSWRKDGLHTSTQMGSGHFAEEGTRKASYFRNLQVVNEHNTLIPAPPLNLHTDNPTCYNIKGGQDQVFGNYFFYGGPGRNQWCP